MIITFLIYSKLINYRAVTGREIHSFTTSEKLFVMRCSSRVAHELDRSSKYEERLARTFDHLRIPLWTEYSYMNEWAPYRPILFVIICWLLYCSHRRRSRRRRIPNLFYFYFHFFFVLYFVFRRLHNVLTYADTLVMDLGCVEKRQTTATTIIAHTQRISYRSNRE